MKKKKLKAERKTLINDLQDSQRACEELTEERDAIEDRAEKLLAQNEVLKTVLEAYKRESRNTREKEYKISNDLENLKILKSLSKRFLGVIETIRESKIEYLAFYTEMQRNHLFKEAEYGSLCEKDEFRLDQIGKLLATL